MLIKLFRILVSSLFIFIPLIGTNPQVKNKGILAIAFSHDKSKMALSLNDSTIRILDVSSGKELKKINGCDQGCSISFSPDNSKIIAINMSFYDNHQCIGEIKIWDIKSCKRIKHFKSNRYLVLSPDGSKIVTESGDVWDITSNFETEIKKLDNSADALHGCPIFSPNSSSIAIINSNTKVIKLQNILSKKKLELKHTNFVWDAKFSPDSSKIASRSSNETIVWDVQSGEKLKIISDFIYRIGFSSDSSRLLMANDPSRKNILIYDLKSNKCIQKKQNNSPNSISFSPVDSTVISSSGDEDYISIWDTKSGKLIKKLKSDHIEKYETFSLSEGIRSVSVNCVTFSNDGLKAASALPNNEIIIWDLKSCKELKRLRDYLYEGDKFDRIFFSPDGSKIIAEPTFDKLKIWDINSGIEIKITK